MAVAVEDTDSMKPSEGSAADRERDSVWVVD